MPPMSSDTRTSPKTDEKHVHDICNDTSGIRVLLLWTCARCAKGVQCLLAAAQHQNIVQLQCAQDWTHTHEAV